MEYYCLTDSDEIGASCHGLKCGKEVVVVDSGLHPKRKGYEALPPHEGLKGEVVRSILLTHSHLDHVGSLPCLQKQYPEAEVYMTHACYDLSEAMLHNSVNVMTSQQRELDIPEYPLFTHEQIEEAQERWQKKEYNRLFNVSEEVEAYLQDAGHVLGSCTASIYYGGKKVLFTGDVQTEDQTLIRGADVRPEGDFDALVMETTRGASPRPLGFTREKEEERFAAAITRGIMEGGAVLIPVFAMGKTQEVLTMLYQFKAVGLIPDVPVHVGGLSTKMTMIYDRHARRTRRKAQGFKILRDMDVRVTRRGSRAPLEPRPGEIYCLSSGMMSENTVSNLFARSFINQERNTLLFVGYADPESPAGKIKAARTGELISLDEKHHQGVPLRCMVEEFDFSGHAPREDILELAIASGAQKIFLTHGDAAARAWFRQELKLALPGAEIITPQSGERYLI